MMVSILEIIINTKLWDVPEFLNCKKLRELLGNLDKKFSLKVPVSSVKINSLCNTKSLAFLIKPLQTAAVIS